ncbi:MAG: hypothetical protein ABSH50_05505 [Bryobacteraceae bacterium]|jgi:hypothetical protein
MQRSDWYSDTDPRALAVFIECQRRMSAKEKLLGILELNQMVFDTARAEIRRQNPGMDERAILLRAAARHLDPETMQRVYGWSPADGV